MPQPTNIPDYSIGIVTYVGRYKKYFIEGIKNLSKIFNDKEIICIINGHYDKNLQIEYLRSITSYLKQFPNVKYITNENNQSLSKCWNWTILMKNTPGILILNDDIKITPLFRHEFEKKIINNKIFFTINNSWSHFYITNDIIKKVGWFDERFIGVGSEDGDYMIRMAELNIPITNVACKGILNYVDKQKNAGWANVSEIAYKKYTSANIEFMKKKWFLNHFNDSEKMEYDIKFVWNKATFLAKIKPNMNTPNFYDLSVLKNSSDISNFVFSKKFKKNNILKFFLNHLYINTNKIINKFKIK